jgi:hypothetical protein
MIKKITTKWLESHRACPEAVERFNNQKERDPIRLLELMIRSKNKKILGWANWLIVRIMNKKHQVKYAVYSAELILDNFETQFSDDPRPRQAIEAVKKYLKNQTQENIDNARTAAQSAWSAVRSAEYAALSAGYAVRSAEYAALSTGYAVRSAAQSAGSAAWSAEYAARSAGLSAAWSAGYAAWSAEYAAEYKKTLIKILKYGIEVLRKK